MPSKNVFTFLGVLVALFILVASIPVMVLGGILVYVCVVSVYGATCGWNAVSHLPPPQKPNFEPMTLCRATTTTIGKLWEWASS